MKIGFDGTPLAIPFQCGTRHYSEQLISSLAKIDKINKYIIFSKKDIEIPDQENFKLIKIPASIPILKKQFFLTYLAKREKVDIFHYLEPFGSIFINNLKIVTTVHDLDLSRIYPKISLPKYLMHKIYTELVRKKTFQYTNRFISNSKFTKKQLISHLKKGGLNKSIKVIYLAPHDNFRVIKSKGDIKQKYFLTMGDFSPRKNVIRILKAFAKLDEATKNNYMLKIVISTNDPGKNILENAKQLNIQKNLELIKSPTLTKLVNLYNQASAFLYPSLYEGFGLPILEAMACGCPVITSNRGATKEVSNNAALLVNPESIKEIAYAMRRVIKDERLIEKQINKGFDRVKLFSWETTANQTLSVYKSIISSS